MSESGSLTSPASPATEPRHTPLFPGPGSPLAVGCLGLHSSDPLPSTRKGCRTQAAPLQPHFLEAITGGLARRSLLSPSRRLGKLRP